MLASGALWGLVFSLLARDFPGYQLLPIPHCRLTGALMIEMPRRSGLLPVWGHTQGVLSVQFASTGQCVLAVPKFFLAPVKKSFRCSGYASPRSSMGGPVAAPGSFLRGGTHGP